MTICSGQVKRLQDLKELINKKIKETQNPYNKSMMEIVAFLLDNNYFGTTLSLIENKAFVEDKDVLNILKPLTLFLTKPMESSALVEMLVERFPETTGFLQKFFDEEQTEESIKFYVMDFLLYHLKKDVFLYKDDEIK